MIISRINLGLKRYTLERDFYYTEDDCKFLNKNSYVLTKYQTFLDGKLTPVECGFITAKTELEAIEKMTALIKLEQI